MTEAYLYSTPPHGWTCFHCGDTFTTPGAARDHFGFDPSSDPACRIKIGAERGLVMELRKAEQANAQLAERLHDENSEAYQMLASTQSRHRAQIIAIEEEAYARGLQDGRSEVRPRVAQPNYARLGLGSADEAEGMN